MGYRWNFLLSVIISLVGAGTLIPFLLVDSVGWKTISLLFAVAIILLAIFRWLNLLFVSLPEGHCKRLASSTGIFSAGIYYVLSGQSTIWIALAWVLVVIGFLAMLTALQHILFEFRLLRTLSRDYERTTFPSLPVPFVYVLAEPGLGVYLAQRFVGKIMNSLYEFRYLPSESGLTVYTDSKRSNKWSSRYLWRHRQRGMMLFLVSDSVRHHPINFRKWLARQAAGFIVMRTPLGVDELDTESFNDEANNGYQLCPGPTFTIYVQPRGRGTIPSVTEGDQVFQCSWWFQNRSLDSMVAPLTNRLASNALSTTASDARFTRETRSAIQEIATFALPPIADSYLRFRLAQSEVERFFSLLNCTECLIKCSVVALLASQWNQTNTYVNYKELVGGPPPLGAWIHLLEKLTEVITLDELDRELCKFWKDDMLQIQEQLISEVSKASLALPETRGTSELDWVRWFRDLRNVTRGHGVVEEKSVAPLWHAFHETFLRMVLGLRPLTLSSVLVAAGPNEQQVPLQGWLRGGHRPYSKSPRKSSTCNAVAFLKLPSGEALPIHPLAIIHGNSVLLWDHVRKEGMIEFLNYASGERMQLDFSETDPYRIWERQEIGEAFQESDFAQRQL